jgi:hypothetical protein
MHRSRFRLKFLHLSPNSPLSPPAFKVEGPGELKTRFPGAHGIHDPAVPVLKYDLRVDGEVSPAQSSNFVGWFSESEAWGPECGMLLCVSTAFVE